MSQLIDPTETEEHRLSQEYLSAYLDGDLADRQRAAIERHLAECLRCSRDLADLSATVSLLHRLPAHSTPRPFTVTAPAGRRPSHPLFPVFRLGTILAGLLLLLMVSVDFWVNVRSMAPVSLGVRQEAPAPDTDNVAVATADKDLSAAFSPPAEPISATSTVATGEATLELQARVARPPSGLETQKAAGDAETVGGRRTAQSTDHTAGRGIAGGGQRRHGDGPHADFAGSAIVATATCRPTGCPALALRGCAG